MDDLGGVVAVTASPDARLVDVRVTGPSVAVVAVGYSGEELGASPAFVDLMNRAAATGTSVEEFYGGPLPPSGVVREPEPNRFQMDVPARGLVFLAIVPTDTDSGTLAVRGPDQDWDDATYADDSDEGLYCLDAVVDYTAQTAGIHQIEVANLDPCANGYRFSVKAAG